MTWIKTRERLPVLGQDVLIFLNRPTLKNKQAISIGCLEGLGSTSHTWSHYGVTHWMPLPEPPKDQKQ